MENANIQMALKHSLATRNADTAQRIVAGTWRFWQARGHLAEGAIAARAALDIQGSAPSVRAEALDAAGSIAYWAGDIDATRSYYENAVSLHRESGEVSGLAKALYNLSFPVADVDGLDAATVILDESIALATADDDGRTLSLAYAALSRSWLDTSPERSRGYAQKAIDGAVAVGDPISEAWGMSLHAAASHHMGEYITSTRHLQHSLATFLEYEDLPGIALNLAGIAENARSLGDERTALFLVGAVIALREDSGIGVRTAIDDAVNEFSSNVAVEALSSELRSACEQGRTASLDRLNESALAWNPANSDSTFG